MDEFLKQVLTAIAQFGGLPWVGKIALIVMLIVAALKSSALAFLWNWMGKAKPWAVVGLSLVGGILSLSLQSNLTFAGVMAYVSAGAGAIILSELLELVKTIPGIGPLWLAAIQVIEGVLKKPVAPPAP